MSEVNDEAILKAAESWVLQDVSGPVWIYNEGEKSVATTHCDEHKTPVDYYRIKDVFILDSEITERYPESVCVSVQAIVTTTQSEDDDKDGDDEESTNNYHLRVWLDGLRVEFEAMD